MIVLVADPDPVSRGLIHEVATVRGHRCEAVGDGDAAWASYLRRCADLVLCTPRLTGLSGWELLQWVREEAGDRTQVVMLVDPEEGDRRQTALELGADDYLVKPLNPEELALRVQVAERTNALRVQVAEQAVALAELRGRLDGDAAVDPLTGAGTAGRLRSDLADLGARVARYGGSFVVALVGIDRLDDCALAFGVAGRDRALQAVGATLKGRCRAGDRVYRTEDDCFLVLLPEQSLHAGQAALERLRRTVGYLEIPRTRLGGDHLSVSVGLARIQRGEDGSPQDAVGRAAAALADAREQGGDRVCLYESPRYAVGMNLAAR